MGCKARCTAPVVTAGKTAPTLRRNAQADAQEGRLVAALKNTEPCRMLAVRHEDQQCRRSVPARLSVGLASSPCERRRQLMIVVWVFKGPCFIGQRHAPCNTWFSPLVSLPSLWREFFCHKVYNPYWIKQKGLVMAYVSGGNGRDKSKSRDNGKDRSKKK